MTKSGEEIETIFLTETALVPVDIPINTLFISKDKASWSDFVELLLVFDESFSETSADFAILGLGAYDISTKEKFITFNMKTNLQEFARQPNMTKRLLEQKFMVLIQMVREIKGAKKIISTDPISFDSNGFHNRNVEHVSTHVTRNDDEHTHLYTKHRFQRNKKRGKNKNSENFPLIPERYAADAELLESEKQIQVTATLKALKEDGNVNVENFVFKRRF